MKLFLVRRVGPLGLLLLGLPSLAAAGGKGELLPVHISVFNYAPISGEMVEKAEREASRVLQDAGVETIWQNCLRETREKSPDACGELSWASHFDLRIIPRSRNLKGSALGIAFFADDGRGCCADLFYEPILGLLEESDASPSVVLGYAMVHELGHLLLGIDAHTPNGLMRAHWTREDLKNASLGNLWFSTEQSIRMRRRLRPQEHQAIEAVETVGELGNAERFH